MKDLKIVYRFVRLILKFIRIEFVYQNIIIECFEYDICVNHFLTYFKVNVLKNTDEVLYTVDRPIGRMGFSRRALANKGIQF